MKPEAWKVTINLRHAKRPTVVMAARGPMGYILRHQGVVSESDSIRSILSRGIESFDSFSEVDFARVGQLAQEETKTQVDEQAHKAEK